jgi:hypothetical protein
MKENRRSNGAGNSDFTWQFLRENIADKNAQKQPRKNKPLKTQ